MTIRIAVNGPGRIGRSIVRANYEENFNDVELVAINSSAPLETLAHLLRYDSVHGRFNYPVEIKNQKLFVNNKEVIICNQRDPKKLPWKEMNIDLVFECTGAFTSLEDATMHIESGAKKVIISAPAKEPNVKTIIYGVNDNTLTSQDSVISIGSCTTNCLAPIAKILNDTIGIQKGFMTTIHAYTNDQNIVDNAHKDLRRARACAMSMIPTSTGAAKAIGLVLPELKGKLDGVAIRVPTPNVSMVDLNFIANKNTSTSEVNSIIRDAIKGNMSRALQYVDEPLVSIDFNHNSFSSCFDATQTKVIGENLVKVCSWYDNEWAFSVRMLDVARLMIK
jgi:glyceraldehyde 3-phosphate dehydrogenase